jgi:hypothetical protein
VVAPFGGVVTAINARGQTVSSQGVLQLVSVEMEIRVDVDESNLADLALGQPAVLSSGAFPGSTFPGTVREIAAADDQSRGTVTVTVAPIKPPLWLRPGQTVNVNVVTDPAAQRLLNTAALLARRRPDNGPDRGTTVPSKVVQTRPPTSGVGGGGLDAGDRVITNRRHQLEPVCGSGLPRPRSRELRRRARRGLGFRFR